MAKKADTSASKKKKKRGKRAWKLMSGSLSTAAGLLAARGLDATWRTATRRTPPNKPESPEVAAREALLWAALTGLAMGVTKVYVTRRAAEYWVRSFGELPPGMENEPDKKNKKKKLKAQAAA